MDYYPICTIKFVRKLEQASLPKKKWLFLVVRTTKGFAGEIFILLRFFWHGKWVQNFSNNPVEIIVLKVSCTFYIHMTIYIISYQFQCFIVFLQVSESNRIKTKNWKLYGKYMWSSTHPLWCVPHIYVDMYVHTHLDTWTLFLVTLI